jgi:hypothetical protein
MSVRKAVKYFAWYWRDRPYRTAPHIKARLRRSTLVNLYYHWRRNGKSPNCFGLHYGDRLATITVEEIRRFVDACGEAGTASLGQAARLAGFERGRDRRILARLPGPLVRRIKALFKERHQGQLQAREVAAQLQGRLVRATKAILAERSQAELEARKLSAQLQGRLNRLRAGVVSRGRKLDTLLNSFIARRGGGGMDSTSFEKDRPVQDTGEIFKALPQEVGKRVSRGGPTMSETGLNGLSEIGQEAAKSSSGQGVAKCLMTV